MTQNERKMVFFKVIEKFVHNFFFWIRSMLKVYIICSIPVQILYLGNTWFLGYGSKCSWPINYWIFKSSVSVEWKDEIAWIVTCYET